jgi:hypothetical protein
VTPHVSEWVKTAALELAAKVWARQELSKAVLLYGMNPASANEWLAHAEAMGWVVDDHGQIKRGSQNPALQHLRHSRGSCHLIPPHQQPKGDHLQCHLDQDRELVDIA